MRFCACPQHDESCSCTVVCLAPCSCTGYSQISSPSKASINTIWDLKQKDIKTSEKARFRCIPTSHIAQMCDDSGYSNSGTLGQARGTKEQVLAAWAELYTMSLTRNKNLQSPIVCFNSAHGWIFKMRSQVEGGEFSCRRT